jgi:hypothetical protein
MIDVVEVFDSAKNVEFKKLAYYEKLDAELATFTLADIPTKEWNRRAERTNTKMFVEVHNRQPKNYDEVLSWVWSLISEQKENQPTVNELEFA